VRDNYGTHKIKSAAFHLFFPDGAYPPNTLVVVQSLMRSEFLVEIQALAVLPD